MNILAEKRGLILRFGVSLHTPCRLVAAERESRDDDEEEQGLEHGVLHGVAVPHGARTGPASQTAVRRSRREFPITDTDEKLIAAAASTGDSRIPKNG